MLKGPTNRFPRRANWDALGEKMSPSFWLVFDLLTSYMERGGLNNLSLEEKEAIKDGLHEMEVIFGKVDIEIWRYFVYRRFNFTLARPYVLAGLRRFVIIS